MQRVHVHRQLKLLREPPQLGDVDFPAGSFNTKTRVVSRAQFEKMYCYGGGTTPALVCFATQHCPSLKPKGKVTLPHSDSLPDHYTRNNVRDRAMQVIQTRITRLYVHVAGRTRPLVHFACARAPAARNSCTNVRRPMHCMALPAEAHMYST